MLNVTARAPDVAEVRVDGVTIDTFVEASEAGGFVAVLHEADMKIDGQYEVSPLYGRVEVVFKMIPLVCLNDWTIAANLKSDVGNALQCSWPLPFALRLTVRRTASDWGVLDVATDGTCTWAHALTDQPAINNRLGIIGLQAVLA